MNVFTVVHNKLYRSQTSIRALNVGYPILHFNMYSSALFIIISHYDVNKYLS